MSAANSRNSPPAEAARPRRESVTGQAFTNLFNRANSVSGAPTPAFPQPLSATTQEQRRRMSITTLGLSGTSPTQASLFPFGGRRTSVSTAGGSTESAIDDEDFGPGSTNPPFTHRLSFGTQARRASRPNGGSPGTAGEGFSWSENLRSRAESSVSQSQRPNFSMPSTTSAPTLRNPNATEAPAAMPAPVAAPVRKRPDDFQERILKGDFYMD